MLSYIVRRILWTIPVLFITLLFTFLLMNALPGDRFSANPALRANPETLAALQKRWGLDRPWYVQYAKYVEGLARGDLGQSARNPNRTVGEIIAERAPRSAIIGGLSFVFAAIVGTIFGVASALRHNRPVDYVSTLLSTIGFAVPTFVTSLYWVAYVPKYAREVGLGSYFPISGFTTPWHWIGPTIVLGFSVLPYFARLVRGTMLETLHADYVLTARAKGLPWRRTVSRHVLRNSLIPAVTNAGPLLGFLITGSFIIERIFNIPGVANLFIDSVTGRDYNMVFGLTFLLACVIIFANLVVDIVYGFLDPRIRRS